MIDAICVAKLEPQRFWPEINNRINYPLKTALLQLVDQEELKKYSLVRYCSPT